MSERSFCSSSSGRSRQSFGEVPPSSSEAYLCLSKPIAVFESFEQTQPKTNSQTPPVTIFFDHVLNQLFVVRSHGVTGVSTYTSLPSTSPLSLGGLKTPQFMISSPEIGPIRSIKRSADESCLTVRRANQSSTVEFLLFKEPDLYEFAFYQHCKAKNAKLQEFYWIGSCQLLFITNTSVEYYSVNVAKKQVKLVKSVSMNVSWSVFHLMPLLPKSNGTSFDVQGLLVVSTTEQQNVLHPFIFKTGTSSGSITRLAKFEVDMPMSSKRPGQKQILLESAVSLLTVYGESYVSVIRKQSAMPNSPKPASELVLYRITKDAPAKKNFILRLATEAGSFAVNAVDNLVVVHYQELQVSMLFDVRLPGDTDGFITYLNPLLLPAGIGKAPHIFDPLTGKSREVLLYDKAWVVFRPDVIINPKIGVMWKLTLDLKRIVPNFTTNTSLLRFLQMRYNSRQLQLDLFKKFFSEKTVTLAESATLFDISNDAYRKFIELDRAVVGSSPGVQTGSTSTEGRLACGYHSNSVLHQKDMLTIFEDMLYQPMVSPERSRFIVAVMLEFIQSLLNNCFKVDFDVEDVLVSHLVRTGQYYQLHQLLQYYVINDRKQMACKLLTLHRDYPPAIQLALDMLKRIGVKAYPEILELLLSNGDVITAINFAKKFNLKAELKRPDKFLEVAKCKGDRVLFYSTYKFFENYNATEFNHRGLMPTQKSEQYTEHFKCLFGESSLNEQTAISIAAIAGELNVF